MASMYAVYHGPKGLKYIANKIHQLCSTLNDGFKRLNILQTNKSFFDTLTIVVSDVDKLREESELQGLNFFYSSENTVQISLNCEYASPKHALTLAFVSYP